MIFYICLIFVILFEGINGGDLPDTIKKCSRNDPNISECVKQALISLDKIWFPSSPQSPDLLPLGNFDIKNQKSNSAFQLDMKFPNLVINGYKNFIIKDLKVNFTNTCEVNIKYLGRKYVMTSDYKIVGKSPLIPINAKGKMTATLTDVKTNPIAQCEFYKKNNLEYIRLLDMQVGEPSYKNVQLKLTNLYPGNEEISNALQTVINDNSKFIFAEAGHDITKLIYRKIIENYNKFLDDIPVNKLFLD